MTPAEKRRATILARELRDTAYHEAGHAVGYWAHGYRFSSLHIWDDEGNRTGRTQGDSASQWDQLQGITEGARVCALMADVVDERRGVRRSGAHVVETWEQIGARETQRLVAVARELVERHWEAIAELAELAITDPEHTLFPHQVEDVRVRHGFQLGPTATAHDQQFGDWIAALTSAVDPA